MWFYYAVFFAVWAGFGAIIAKGKFKDVPSVAVPFLILLVALPSILVLLLVTTGIPSVTHDYFIYIILAGILDSVAFVSAFLAIKKTDISLLAPMTAFAPALTTIFAIFTLNEIPSISKFGAIGLIVFGAYLLNVSEISKGIFSPIQKLFSNSGVQIFLVSNLIWSVTPIFQKKAILETYPQAPLFSAFGGLTVSFLLLAPFAIPAVRKNIKKIRKQIRWFLVYGVGLSFSQLAAYTAYSMTNVGYVSSVMRLESIITIVLGGRILKEKGIRQKLLGAIVMIVGALILAM